MCVQPGPEFYVRSVASVKRGLFASFVLVLGGFSFVVVSLRPPWCDGACSATPEQTRSDIVTSLTRWVALETNGSCAACRKRSTSYEACIFVVVCGRCFVRCARTVSLLNTRTDAAVISKKRSHMGRDDTPNFTMASAAWFFSKFL